MNSFAQGLDMKSLMESDDYVNNTDRIRQLKHSENMIGLRRLNLLINLFKDLLLH